MATSDLQNELLKPSFKVDPKTEEKLCTAVLQQLQDVSGDISALAVKWCGCLILLHAGSQPFGLHSHYIVNSS